MNAHARDFREIPRNIEAEHAVLGAIMVENAAFDRVSSFLEAQHFHEPLHQKIFRIAGEMLQAGRLVSPVTIKGLLPATVENLKLDGEDASVLQYLARIAASAVPPIQARDYGMAVYDAWMGREALSVAEEAVTSLLNLDMSRDVLAQLEPVEQRIASLRADSMRSENRAGIGKRFIEGMTAANQRGFIAGVPICLPELEDVLSEPCYEAGNLYGLLSSSGEGKTSLTVQQIFYAVERDHPVQLLTYDQSSDQLVRQMAAQHLGIEVRRQRNPRLLSEKEWGQLVDFAQWIDRKPLDIIKVTDHGAAQLVSLARTFVKRKSNGKVPLIVVDHIGSVKPEDKRADEGTKAKDLNKVFKAGAEQTGAAWLVLNQRNSYGMRRDNPRPISQDLFGGDPAKQAYDAIAYLYRQEKFKAERVATAASEADWKKINKVFGTEIEGVAEIGAIKVRFGNPTITRQIRFEDRLTRYHSERDTTQPELLEGM